MCLGEIPPAEEWDHLREPIVASNQPFGGPPGHPDSDTIYGSW
jgi:hypothetical protein